MINKAKSSSRSSSRTNPKRTVMKKYKEKSESEEEEESREQLEDGGFPDVFELKWVQKGTLHYLTSNSIKGSDKIVGIDLVYEFIQLN